MPAASRLDEARFQLLTKPRRLLLDLFVLGHDQADGLGRPQKLQHRQLTCRRERCRGPDVNFIGTGVPLGEITLIVIVEALAHRDNEDLVDRTGGSLRGRIEAT